MASFPQPGSLALIQVLFSIVPSHLTWAFSHNTKGPFFAEPDQLTIDLLGEKINLFLIFY